MLKPRPQLNKSAASQLKLTSRYLSVTAEAIVAEGEDVIVQGVGNPTFTGTFRVAQKATAVVRGLRITSPARAAAEVAGSESSSGSWAAESNADTKAPSSGPSNAGFGTSSIYSIARRSSSPTEHQRYLCSCTL